MAHRAATGDSATDEASSASGSGASPTQTVFSSHGAPYEPAR